jgi:hypothetical protein
MASNSRALLPLILQPPPRLRFMRWGESSFRRCDPLLQGRLVNGPHHLMSNVADQLLTAADQLPRLLLIAPLHDPPHGVLHLLANTGINDSAATCGISFMIGIRTEEYFNTTQSDTRNQIASGKIRHTQSGWTSPPNWTRIGGSQLKPDTDCSRNRPSL